MPAEVTSSVRFLGAVTDERKQELLREVQVYVAPHTGGESFGIVLVEAMAAGSCVVASDIPAFRHVLEDGKSGRLFTARDPSALADAVLSVLADDAARRALVSRGFARAAQYDWDTVIDDVLAVYERFVKICGDRHWEGSPCVPPLRAADATGRTHELVVGRRGRGRDRTVRSVLVDDSGTTRCSA